MAGGLNLYGFAGGDPVNFADPFGLCVDEDTNCKFVVALLRSQKGSEFQDAADRFEAEKSGMVFFYARHQNVSGHDVRNVDGDPTTYTLGQTRGKGGDVFLRVDISKQDLLLTAVHESLHLSGEGESAASHAAYRAYQQLTTCRPPSPRSRSNRCRRGSRRTR